MAKKDTMEDLTVAEAMSRLTRAGRALLDWTQEDLAERAGISVSGLKKYEGCVANTVGMTNTLKVTFAEAGVELFLSQEPGETELTATLRLNGAAPAKKKSAKR